MLSRGLALGAILAAFTLGLLWVQDHTELQDAQEQLATACAWIEFDKGASSIVQELFDEEREKLAQLRQQFGIPTPTPEPTRFGIAAEHVPPEPKCPEN
ncbi:MAG TPA: hypothetical protein VIH52_04840 [Candidatus Nanoarchaeia archaeon]|nr:hypothetical protein [uncultured archaeon]